MLGIKYKNKLFNLEIFSNCILTGISMVNKNDLLNVLCILEYIHLLMDYRWKWLPIINYYFLIKDSYKAKLKENINNY